MKLTSRCLVHLLILDSTSGTREASEPEPLNQSQTIASRNRSPQYRLRLDMNLIFILGLYWGYIGVTLGLYWCYIGVTLGLYWAYIGVTLGLYWGYIGVTLGLYWALYWAYIGMMEKKMEATVMD